MPITEIAIFSCYDKYRCSAPFNQRQSCQQSIETLSLKKPVDSYAGRENNDRVGAWRHWIGANQRARRSIYYRRVRNHYHHHHKKCRDPRDDASEPGEKDKQSDDRKRNQSYQAIRMENARYSKEREREPYPCAEAESDQRAGGA